MAQQDLIPGGFPDFPCDQDYEQFLRLLFEYAVGQATKASDWYYRGRNYKRFFGSSLRYGAIVATTVAGTIPIYSTIAKNSEFWPQVDPGWSGIAIALTGMLVAIDKFGGFTSGWLRYIQAGQAIGNELEAFKLEWYKKRMQCSNPISSDDTIRMIETAATFLASVREIINQETARWVGEFQAVLSEIDSMLKQAKAQKTKPRQTGAINIEVTNGQQCPDGWTLQSDTDHPRVCKGKSASLNQLAPGLITLSINGVIDDRAVNASQSVKVSEGEIANVSLTLV